MPSTKDVQSEQQGIFALFKGDSGSGKTVGALSWPGIYLFDLDKKMPGIALKHFPEKDISYDTFDDMFGVSNVLNNFVLNGCPYETLVIDSLTALVINILNSVGNLKGEKAIEKLQTLKSTRGGGKMIELMGIDYYNAETNFIELYLMDTLKSLWARPGNPKNIILIAHVMTTDYSNIITRVTTKTRSLVTAGKKVGSYVPTCFDDSWHFAYEIDMASGRNKRIVLTDGIGEDSAKTSFRLPYKMDFTGTPPLYEDGNLYKVFMKYVNKDISL